MIKYFVFIFTVLLCKINGNSNIVIKDYLENCKSLKEIQTDLASCFFYKVNFIKIVIIFKGTKRDLIDYSAEVYLVAQKYEIPILIQHYPFEKEHSLDYTMMFSWLGNKKIPLRPSQNASYMTINNRIYSKWTENYIGVFVIIDNLKDLDDFFLGTNRPPFHTPQAQYLIVILKEIEEKLLDHIFRKMWNDYAILRVVILSCRSKVVHYFDPFHRNLSYQELDYFNGWGKLVKEDFNKYSEICDRCKPTYPISMNQYPIKTAVFYRNPTAVNWHELPKSYTNSLSELLPYSGVLEDPANSTDFSEGFGGVEGIIFANLALAVDFKAILNVLIGRNKYGAKSENGTFEGSIGEVIYGKAIMVGNPHFIQDYETNDIQFLNPIFADRFCVVTPKSKRIPQSGAIFTTFALSTWIIILILNFTLGIFWHLMKILLNYIHRNKKLRLSWSQSLIDITIIMTGSSISSIIKFKMSERIYFFGVFAFSVILNGIFNSRLIYALSNIWYYKDIDTLYELDKSDLEIAVTSPSLRYVFGDNVTNYNPTLLSLARKLQVRERRLPNEPFEGGNVCYMDRKTDHDICMPENLNRDGSLKLNLVEECPRMFYLSYFVRRGWPLFGRFNRALSLYDAGGFRVQWFKDAKKAKRLAIALKEYKLSELITAFSGRNPFSLQDMRIAFLIVTYGLIISSGVFVVELIYFQILLVKSNVVKKFK